MPVAPGPTTATTSWSPAPPSTTGLVERPPFLTALRRGVLGRCPVCGEGRLFSTYLGIVPECSACHAPLGRLRADDAPPYIVIFLTGHLLLPPIFWIERAYEPPMWLHMVIWLPLFTVLCTLLLRPVKGAVVAWMIRLGFADEDSPHQYPAPSPGTPDHG